MVFWNPNISWSFRKKSRIYFSSSIFRKITHEKEVYYNRIGQNDVGTLSNRVLSAWVHFFFSAFDRSITWRYRCAWTQLNKFSSWPQFWIEISQNILKNCLKACWTTFSLKVLLTLNFLAYFFSLKMKNENFASRNCYNKNY